MPLKKGQRNGGIYEVEDLRLRSRIEPECGCWRWGLRVKESGAAQVTLVIDGKKHDVTGRRAALILAGKRPRRGQEALPRPECLFCDCVNPAHSCWGTRAERQAILGERGRWSNPEMYAAIAEYARSKRKLDDDQRLEVMCSDESGADLARRLGVSPNLIGQIRRKVHTRPATSVFDWRG